MIYLVGFHHTARQYAREHKLSPNEYRSVQRPEHLMGVGDGEFVWLHDAFMLDDIRGIIEREEMIKAKA